MYIKLTKCSEPGWENYFSTLSSTRINLEQCLCRGCSVTQEEAHKIIEEEGLPEHEADDLLFDAKPSDYDQMTDYQKIIWMLGTACGCEYGFDIYDGDLDEVHCCG